MNRDFFDELYKKTNRPEIDKIEKELDIVKGLDEQIERLVYQRSLVLKSAKETGLELCNTNFTVCINSTELEKAYNNSGFKSKVVKDAVANVRTYFFDDSLEEFQKFNCVEINFGDNYSNAMCFEFSDGSGCEIGIVISDRKFSSNVDYASYRHSYESPSDRRYLLDGEFIDGKFAFYIKYDIEMVDGDKKWKCHNKETIDYSFDLLDIRQSIKNFVLRDKKITPEDFPKHEFKHYSFLEMIENTMGLKIDFIS